MRKLIGVSGLLVATSSLAPAQEQRKDTSDKKAPAADAKKQPGEKGMAQHTTSYSDNSFPGIRT